MRINYTKIQVLKIFLSLISHYQRTYCWPTRKKIQKLLQDRYKTSISLSAIDQHLSDLNTKKYIRSFRQTGRRDDGTVHNLPSNRQLTWKAVVFFMGIGIRVPRWLIAWLKTRQLPGTRKPGLKKTSYSGAPECDERSVAGQTSHVGKLVQGLAATLDPDTAAT